MNNYESNFDDYIKNYIDIFNIEKYKNFLDNNLIVYGPCGIGKYSFVLNLIQDRSNTNLKYNKKMVVTFNKNDFYFRISDIHYEIDVMLLGCNAKLLWHEIYNHIVDSFISKNQEIAYIVLKNFHKINNELLDIFNTYMQLDIINYTNIKYIIITESINFLSDNIFNRYKLINLERPTKSSYVKILGYKLDKNDDINNITNIQDIKKKSFNMESSYKFMADIYTYAKKEFLEVYHKEFINTITLPTYKDLKTYWEANIYYDSIYDEQFNKYAQEHFSNNDNFYYNKVARLVSMSK